MKINLQTQSNKMKKNLTNLLLSVFICLSLMTLAFGQKERDSKNDRKSKERETTSIGGKEHDAEIVGVKIGMDIPTALEAVFINAKRQPGQEKPDSKRNEGKDNKDIRVIYKNLPQGELQIVFADGKFVKEIVLRYAKPPTIDDLRLPYTGFIGDDTVINPNRPDVAINASEVGNTNRERGESFDGTRFDDRYSVGFTDIQRVQRTWWRDEKTTAGYSIRVQFFSANKLKDAGAKFVVTAVQKLLSITPGDQAKFANVFSLSGK